MHVAELPRASTVEAKKNPSAGADLPPAEFPVVDHSIRPRTGAITSMAFWAHYMARHYFCGPKRGHYGPNWMRTLLNRLEKRIEKQSKKTGEIPVKPVPRVPYRHLSAADFQRIYLKSNTPVVIEGMANNWPAVKNWSPDWFKRNYGDYKIPVRIKSDRLDDTALVIRDMTLAQLVDNINAGGKFMGGNLEDVFNDNPHLRGDLDLNELSRYEVANKHAKIGSTQLFMSGAGTRSGYHCTNGINLFVQVHGHKEWSFVSPKFSKWMHPITRKDMFYAATMFNWTAPFNELEKNGYPLYRYCPKFFTKLNPGDVLFSPQWWWHAVDTTCPSVAVATRTMNRFTIGNQVFSFIWLTSPEFMKLFYTLMKTGWGSDKDSGARRAFEEEFVDKVTA